MCPNSTSGTRGRQAPPSTTGGGAATTGCRGDGDGTDGAGSDATTTAGDDWTSSLLHGMIGLPRSTGAGLVVAVHCTAVVTQACGWAARDGVVTACTMPVRRGCLSADWMAH